MLGACSEPFFRGTYLMTLPFHTPRTSGSHKPGRVWQYFRGVDTVGVGRSGARRTGENEHSLATTVEPGIATLCVCGTTTFLHGRTCPLPASL